MQDEEKESWVLGRGRLFYPPAVVRQGQRMSRFRQARMPSNQGSGRRRRMTCSNHILNAKEGGLMRLIPGVVLYTDETLL